MTPGNNPQMEHPQMENGPGLPKETRPRRSDRRTPEGSQVASLPHDRRAASSRLPALWIQDPGELVGLVAIQALDHRARRQSRRRR